MKIDALVGSPGIGADRSAGPGSHSAIEFLPGPIAYPGPAQAVVAEASHGRGLGATGIVAVFLGASLILLNIAGLYFQKPAELVVRQRFTLDFSDMFHGAVAYLGHQNPYQDLRFVTPPFSLVIPSLLSGFDLDTAGRIFFFCNIACCGLALFALVKLAAIERPVWRSGLLVLVMCQPFLFLIERGNIDGIVLLLVSLAILCRNELLAGFSLGCGILVKLYPLILVPSLAVTRRPAFFLGLAVAGVLDAIAFPSLTAPFLHQLLGRTIRFRTDENVSLFAILGALSPDAPNSPILLLSGAAVLLAVAAVGLYFDFRLIRRCPVEVRRVLVASWMIPAINFPVTVYAYSAIVVLPLLLLFDAARRSSPFGTPASALLPAGCALLFVHSIGWCSVTGVYAVHYLPPLGSILLLIWFVVLRLDLASRVVPEQPSGERHGDVAALRQ